MCLQAEFLALRDVLVYAPISLFEHLFHMFQMFHMNIHQRHSMCMTEDKEKHKQVPFVYATNVVLKSVVLQIGEII